ncbi:DCC family protein, chloroplastic [Tanacetum coccineum]|uniref:DCC family protein, chloroplastic n=1 Tax=Tanacetum coccineum TaxID=301880 RepID=A0ABQ4YGB7_9ASTR
MTGKGKPIVSCLESFLFSSQLNDDHALDHCALWRMRFESLQSDAGKNLLQRSGRAPDDISSVVLVEKSRSYIKSEAVLKIMEYIDLPFPQLAFFLQFVPLFVRDFVYENIADNRYAVFGRSDSCEI